MLFSPKQVRDRDFEQREGGWPLKVTRDRQISIEARGTTFASSTSCWRRSRFWGHHPSAFTSGHFQFLRPHSHEPGEEAAVHSAVDFKSSSARCPRGGIDRNLPVLSKSEPEWIHTTGVRFNSGQQWQSQWHPITDLPDVHPASATPPGITHPFVSDEPTVFTASFP